MHTHTPLGCAHSHPQRRSLSQGPIHPHTLLHGCEKHSVFQREKEREREGGEGKKGEGEGERKREREREGEREDPRQTSMKPIWARSVRSCHSCAGWASSVLMSSHYLAPQPSTPLIQLIKHSVLHGPTAHSQPAGRVFVRDRERQCV